MPSLQPRATANSFTRSMRKMTPGRLPLLAGMALITTCYAAFAPQDNPNSHSQDTNHLASRAQEILKDIPDSTESPVRPTFQVAATSRQHDRWKMEFEERIYEWQFITSKLVFFIVIGMVLAGFYFSWMHFRASFRPQDRRRKVATASPHPEVAPSGAAEPDPETPTAAQVTQFEAYGFKISTPVFGVVILAVSLAFFYFYLQTVYPIK